MKTLSTLEQALYHALDAISDPLTGESLTAAERVKSVSVDQAGHARIVIEAPHGASSAYFEARDRAEAAVRRLKGVKNATVVLTAEAEPRPPAAAAAQPGRRREGLPNVRRVVAIASAKGGVGKSTFAINFACALAQRGLRVGLLDLDVYGPSLPTLLGLNGVKPEAGPDGVLQPLQAHGLKAMSIGFIVNAEQPMVWRGAMATQAVRQMLEEVAWGAPEAPLDVLVLDLPPGTGDIHLTLVQRLPLDGAVIVSTPQELALADVRRGLAMFEKTHVPILGVVENMAWLELADGVRVHVFGEGGARLTAERLGAPFLGELPIDVSLRESADAGRPLVAAQPDHPMAQRFARIAESAIAQLEVAARAPPAIRFVN